ncbi:4Fe-4S binding protein [Eggerthella guodeyinii]|uniref:4Fe-4S binding protein n=2 Tax=Eggerthella TaxID=84111 RepID=A0A6L7INT9_9ACTN|nr:4Fe-4S binding protein [Eggerthella guodeyinii]QOS68130.1 4Fe-4S binding protein [Eggerthella guodeyinii]
MSDSNLNQNTSEDRDARANGPEAAPAAAAPAPEGDPKQKTFTRRTVLAMAGCGVAGLAVGGVLASWGVTSRSIASGRIEIRTTPTKMIVTDRARCSGCQRCEMMCTLKNDGRVSQHTARVRVWQNYNWGANPDGPDGVYKSCEFTVEHCKQCAEAACMEYCPVHAIYASEDNGARMVDADRCIGCGMCASACPWNMPRVDSESRVSTKCVSCGRCAEQCPNGAIKFIDWEDIAQKVIEQGVVRTTTLVQA